MTIQIPKYRRQKRKNSTDIAFVELNGQRQYLGHYGTSQSRQQYHSLMAQWQQAGGQLPVEPDKITIVELIARFWQHARQHYRKPDGTPTSEQDNFKIALKPLKELYGLLPVKEFGPLKLKTVRQKMIEKGMKRQSINHMVGRIRRMFRWGVENELVKADTLHALEAVTGLKNGRSEAKESEPVKPVPQAHIDAIRPLVSRQVWALIQLQLHTAARSGELVKIRAIDIDTSGTVWTYTPEDHKTAHHGHQRIIYIGPKAQQIIQPFMADKPVTAYLFSPHDAVKEKTAKALTHRRPNQKPDKKKTSRIVKDYYSRDSYRRAIQRACRQLAIPQWHPHQLRHNAATFIRKEYGLEAAQIMLGHAKADVTQIYAEINQEKAMQIAAKIG